MKIFLAVGLTLLVVRCACWGEEKCTIGLERDRYSVLEGDTVEICVEYVSGECPDEELNVTLLTGDPIFESMQGVRTRIE
jgi:hypothetical protein